MGSMGHVHDIVSPAGDYVSTVSVTTGSCMGDSDRSRFFPYMRGVDAGPEYHGHSGYHNSPMWKEEHSQTLRTTFAASHEDPPSDETTCPIQASLTIGLLRPDNPSDWKYWRGEYLAWSVDRPQSRLAIAMF